ncbi:putative oxidoreductase [Crotalus adamanteus]|uniref:Oxidoreductase n=1 Tax=Crotalus adamanteus TaxID=8729 RepID=A0AAW1ASH6_CROAD
MAKADDFSVFSILVTGSDRGIGLGLVKRFLELPCPPEWVFATTLDLEGEETKELRDLACKYLNLVVLQLDVTKLESIQAALKEVQKCVGEAGLTILYNNAGDWDFKDLQAENAYNMMRTYSVNTIGPLLMSQAFLPLLKKAARRSPRQGLSSSKAAIINVSSISGSIELLAGWDVVQGIAYRCSKPEITVEESTRGIVTVLSKLCEKDNGTFLDWLDRRLPWIQSGDRSGSGEEVSRVALSTQMGLCYNSGYGGRENVLVTGSDRGIGLGLVKRFLELPCPPKWVFATTLDLEGEETKAFLSLLKKAARKSPRQGLSSSKAAIINISSALGSMEVMLIWEKAQIVSYRCSKAALNMLTKCQSLEYPASGILTVAIHPGLVNTRHNRYPEITVEESTQGIVSVLSMLSEEDNGTFKDCILVTGSDRGISLSLVKRFLELPCPPKWVFATTLDLKGEETKADDFSVFSVLVTGSDRGIGLGLVKRFLELPCPPEWVFATTLDLEGEETKAFLPLLKMAARRNPCQGLSSIKAAVINMSSIAGSVENMAGYLNNVKIIAYRCSKCILISQLFFSSMQAALNMLTKCQSLAYPADGIMSVAIHPGSVKTARNSFPEITVEESTQGIVTVLSMLSEEDNGTFLDWLGRRVPW